MWLVNGEINAHFIIFYCIYILYKDIGKTQHVIYMIKTKKQ